MQSACLRSRLRVLHGVKRGIFDFITWNPVVWHQGIGGFADIRRYCFCCEHWCSFDGSSRSNIVKLLPIALQVEDIDKQKFEQEKKLDSGHLRRL